MRKSKEKDQVINGSKGAPRVNERKEIVQVGGLLIDGDYEDLLKGALKTLERTSENKKSSNK